MRPTLASRKLTLTLPFAVLAVGIGAILLLA